MISEKQFAVSHGAFWHQLLPMAEEYVRTRNRAPGCFASPLESALATDTRGVVNELGFRLFVAGVDHKRRVDALPDDVVKACIRDGLRHIRSLREHGRAPVKAPTKEHVREAVSLAERLVLFFSKAVRRPLAAFPVFPGCGWLDECAGDLLAEKTLFEVKAGERTFRSIDLRQVLAYCALDFASKTHGIGSVCLVNPRLGIFLHNTLEQLCQDLAGRSASEVLGEIVEYVSEPSDRYLAG